MEQSLQALSAKQRMAEWSERISSCRSSGISVKQWYQEHGIVEKTYYYWQRRVFQALTAQQEPYFAKVPVERRNSSQEVAVTVRIGNAEADIYTGADAATVEAICRALKSC
ncbi:IS66 family insertion sequence element accessory protein TnpA [Desulfitobacterium sp. AusDCA]|uniref:IS66 family insertion sequence element accessory protein TnpA n=1 Tax=Desulfitobacterium sp. AusDCA TaxID=3240383 RepID=UPI003DA6D0D6